MSEYFKQYNINPSGKQVGDCTVRAISKALNQTWEQTYIGLCLFGFMLCDMPSANNVWGAYLKHHGFKRYIIPQEFPNLYSVEDFCRDNPQGTYVLAISGHVVCVCDGEFYDTWNSGQEEPIYYWVRKEVSQ